MLTHSMKTTNTHNDVFFERSHGPLLPVRPIEIIERWQGTEGLIAEPKFSPDELQYFAAFNSRILDHLVQLVGDVFQSRVLFLRHGEFGVFRTRIAYGKR